MRSALGRRSGGPLSALRRDWNFISPSGDLVPPDPAPRGTVDRACPREQFFPKIGPPDIPGVISALTRCTSAPLWHLNSPLDLDRHRIILRDFERSQRH